MATLIINIQRQTPRTNGDAYYGIQLIDGETRDLLGRGTYHSSLLRIVKREDGLVGVLFVDQRGRPQGRPVAYHKYAEGKIAAKLESADALQSGIHRIVNIGAPGVVKFTKGTTTLVSMPMVVKAVVPVINVTSEQQLADVGAVLLEPTVYSDFVRPDDYQVKSPVVDTATAVASARERRNAKARARRADKKAREAAMLAQQDSEYAV